MVKKTSRSTKSAVLDGYILEQPEKISSTPRSASQPSSTSKPSSSSSKKAPKSGVHKSKSSKAQPKSSKANGIDIVIITKPPKTSTSADSNTTSETSDAAKTSNEATSSEKPAKLSRKARRLEKLKLRRRHVMPAVFRVLFSLALLGLISILFTWFILWRQNLCNLNETWEFINEKPFLFSYSCLVIFLTMATVAAFTWRPFFTIGLSFAAISIITYIHIQKFNTRATPLLPEDFGMADQAGALMQFVDIWSVVRLVLGVVCILLGSGLLEHYARRVIGQDPKVLPWWRRFGLVPRLTFTLIAFTALALTVRPILHHTSVSKDEQAWITGLGLIDWSQTENYEYNGFVIGFLYNLGRLDTPEPEGYSAEKVRSIVEKYRKLRENDQTERKPLDQLVDNLILVMNESFYDPEILGRHYAHTGGDVVPNLHKIFLKYPSGYMYSPEYGGNTANIEFAAYTSLSNYWANAIPYIGSVSRIKPMPGLASAAQKLGFSTTALHTYDGSTYKRDLVYQNMLFENFLDSSTMHHTEKENYQGYISDSEIYQEVLDILNDGKKKHMVGAITMQNHLPYNAAHYPELHFQLYENVKNGEMVENSFESLNRSDQYLADFIAELDKFEGRTLMIWFGDHAAGVLDDYVSSSNKQERNLTHFTPYFIYTNFEVEDLYTTKEVEKLNAELGFNFPTRGVDLPTVTPNCLANTIYDLLGAKKPTLQYLVDQVCTETPVLAPSYYSDEKPQETTALKDYETVNYDILSGNRYWIEMATD